MATRLTVARYTVSIAGEEEWRLSPGRALQVQTPAQKCLAPGWQVQWHGSSIYGIADALAFDEVLPSEVAGDGHGTAWGRGAYTSRTFSPDARYGTTRGGIEGTGVGVKDVAAGGNSWDVAISLATCNGRRRTHLNVQRRKEEDTRLGAGRRG